MLSWLLGLHSREAGMATNSHSVGVCVSLWLKFLGAILVHLVATGSDMVECRQSCVPRSAYSAVSLFSFMKNRRIDERVTTSEAR